MVIGLTDCSSGSSSSAPPATIPDFAAATFSNSTDIDHPFFSLVPGTVYAHVGESPDEPEIVIVEILDSTRVVMGVTCAVVQDRVFEGGLLIEDTEDWYAQDDSGNVWYMGEEVDNYEYDADGNVINVDHDGAWEAGLDVDGIGSIAQPGYLMKATPVPGDVYYQEYYPGVALDIGQVIALNVPVTLSDGTTHGCLQIRDSSPLSPGALEDKYYAMGIGLVLEKNVNGPGKLELKGTFLTGPDAVPDFGSAFFTNPTQIDNSYLPFVARTMFTYEGESADGPETVVVEVLDTTHVVLGVTCVTVQEQSFLGSLLTEDTFDWYAQDDDGNVWYMGEDSTNYVYDKNGTLIDVNNDGSWEGGLDVAGIGALAEPGYLIKASPAPGGSYNQEFYEGEAEDMAVVVAVGVSVVLENGDSYANCLQTLEWNPLEPDGLEYKFYAPGVGLVLEEGLSEDERLELESVSGP